MPEEEQNKHYPVYLDANILYPFSITLENPQFQILLELSKFWNFDLYIPELAYLEWLNKKKEDIEVNVGRLINTYKHLESNYEMDFFDLSRITSKAIFEKTTVVLSKYLSEMNVTIVESCEVDTKKLIDMSLKRVRPFEDKGEKGFRDTVILLTILRHAKSMDMPCIFISNDGVYAHPDIDRIAKESAVSISVYSSIEEFKESMESFKLKIVETYRKEKQKKLEEFLGTRREQIIDFIRRKGMFSITTLNMLFEPAVPDFALLLSMIHEHPSPLVTPSVININNIELLDITASSLPVETETNVVPVYFWVKLRFLVSVERTYFPLFLYERRIGISGEENSGEGLPYKRELSEESIEGQFPIYADLKSEGDNYIDLVLKKVGENRFASLGKELFKKRTA